MRPAMLCLGGLLMVSAPTWAREGRSRRPRHDGPKVGDQAPDFELKLLPEPGEKDANPEPQGAPELKPAAAAAAEGQAAPQTPNKPPTVKNSDFKGKDYVVLLFSSYT